MRVIVLIKEVPDTYGARKLDLQTGLADRAATEAVVDEISERALEVALAYADTHDGTEVVALTMGPPSAAAALRKALAMGASEAIHVVDDVLAGSDLLTTAEVLAAAIRGTTFDLIIAGDRSTDGSGGALPAALAEFLDVPHATALGSVELTASDVTGTRATTRATSTVVAALPAVISITEALPDPRFAGFKGIMAAKKKPLTSLSAADLGVARDDESRAHSIVVGIAERPARVAGVKIVDEGDAAEQLVAFLADAKAL
ncbi:MAG TPA: electron transfer flavoprotein subunit beta/FixA family protein [Pseudolysinimonas sp.]|nr:electron transfer flavoprotein subunit beta/FixA family protein [Pseudolysinimonas sp.]